MCPRTADRARASVGGRGHLGTTIIEKEAFRVMFGGMLRFFEYTVRPAPSTPTRACHGPPRAWHAAPLHTCHACGAVRLLLAWLAM